MVIKTSYFRQCLLCGKIFLSTGEPTVKANICPLCWERIKDNPEDEDDG